MKLSQRDSGGWTFSLTDSSHLWITADKVCGFHRHDTESVTLNIAAAKCVHSELVSATFLLVLVLYSLR